MRLQLLDAKQLLETQFAEACRPSVRWLRTQTANRTIPSIRIGRLVFYEPDLVRAALESKRTVKAKSATAAAR
ncbi:MAG: hypothetical protein HY674_23465 [Chloroflexi bacterium]|nr:hypothetical protein [Chloroflexota bacterium]